MLQTCLRKHTNPSVLWRLGDFPSFLFYSLVEHMYSSYVVISTSVYLETSLMEVISLVFVCFIFFSLLSLSKILKISVGLRGKRLPLNSLRNFNRVGSSFYCQSCLNQKECHREECKWMSSVCVCVRACSRMSNAVESGSVVHINGSI